MRFKGHRLVIRIVKTRLPDSACRPELGRVVHYRSPQVSRRESATASGRECRGTSGVARCWIAHGARDQRRAKPLPASPRVHAIRALRAPRARAAAQERRRADDVAGSAVVGRLQRFHGPRSFRRQFCRSPWGNNAGTQEPRRQGAEAVALGAACCLARARASVSKPQ